jgi:uncharacterized membrane protein (UPF0127 family)
MELPIIVADAAVAPPPPCVRVRVAATPAARLRGLLGHRTPPPFALRLDPCRCVHTFGMRFALDLHWLDADGAVVRVDRGVPPGRLRACRRARAVVEAPAGASILGAS